MGGAGVEETRIRERVERFLNSLSRFQNSGARFCVSESKLKIGWFEFPFRALDKRVGGGRFANGCRTFKSDAEVARPSAEGRGLLSAWWLRLSVAVTAWFVELVPSRARGCRGPGQPSRCPSKHGACTEQTLRRAVIESSFAQEHARGHGIGDHCLSLFDAVCRGECDARGTLGRAPGRDAVTARQRGSVARSSGGSLDGAAGACGKHKRVGLRRDGAGTESGGEGFSPSDARYRFP